MMIQSRRSAHYGVRVKDLALPMQNHASVKMPSSYDGRYPFHFFDGLRSGDPFPNPILVLAINPFFISRAHVNRAVEDTGPFEVLSHKKSRDQNSEMSASIRISYRRPEMRMTDDDGLQPALPFYKLNGRIINESYNVPQDVPFPRLDKNAALSNAELFPRGCRIGQPGRHLRSHFGFGGDVVNPRIMFIRCAFVVLFVGFVVE